MGTKKIVNRDIIADKETGEQLTIRKDVSIQGKPEEFFMVFLTALGSLYKLKNATEIHVLAKLCSMTQFNTNTVLLPAARRKEICEELGMSNSNLTNIFRRLKVAGLITGDEGEFTINPELFWKGTTKAREQFMTGEKGLEMMIRFQVEGDKS